ncbi:hypothetical protein [uncultured Ruegeria sp.]|uniref:hypothetical protein n=1 Tax=uncultured Ruegeria sp. TaxID=259304 RepID=UPI002607DCD9|nr:hypothetical protein [uncultured Ruegeria sp.]
MTAKSTALTRKATRIWRSAQLYVGFHRDKKGNKRDSAKVWPPKSASATIHPNPAEQEAFVVLKSTGNSLSGDVQVKFRSDKIIARRDTDEGWLGVQIKPMAVVVQIADGTWIKVWYDGSVTRATAEDRTTIELDGSVFKRTEFAQAYMSGDGTEVGTETATHNASITESGVQSSLDDDWQTE